MYRSQMCVLDRVVHFVEIGELVLDLDLLSTVVAVIARPIAITRAMIAVV